MSINVIAAAHDQSCHYQDSLTASVEAGVLYVVATPIGNLGDMTLRAIQVLQGVDYIAAEDTRHSKPLLQFFGIATPLVSLHEYNERARIPQLLADLQAGKSVALIADAGTPLISDPGFPLLQALRQYGLKAVPIPGASGLLAALSVAGLPTDRFVFEGFPPARTAARRRRLQRLVKEERTLVFFEASHRLQASLTDMAMIFGAHREAVIARELTKRYEEIHGDTLTALSEWIGADKDRLKGEFVVIVRGAMPTVETSVSIEVRYLLQILLAELPLKRAVALAVELTGLSKNRLYGLALTVEKAWLSDQ